MQVRKRRLYEEAQQTIKSFMEISKSPGKSQAYFTLNPQKYRSHID